MWKFPSGGREFSISNPLILTFVLKVIATSSFGNLGNPSLSVVYLLNLVVTATNTKSVAARHRSVLATQRHCDHPIAELTLVDLNSRRAEQVCIKEMWVVKLENHGASAETTDNHRCGYSVPWPMYIRVVALFLMVAMVALFLNGCIVEWRSDVCMMGIACYPVSIFYGWSSTQTSVL